MNNEKANPVPAPAPANAGPPLRVTTGLVRPLLNDLQPHTPRPGTTDRNLATCSEQTDRNRGCEVYGVCPFAEKERGIGPFQVVVEHHEGVPVGHGTRNVVWCFNAVRLYFGSNKRAGVSLCEDRLYPALDGETWAIKELPPYAEQGPFYRRRADEAPREIRDQMRAEIARRTGRPIPPPLDPASTELPPGSTLHMNDPEARERRRGG